MENTITRATFSLMDKIITKMSELRSYVDEAEHITASKYWPYPTYSELLFGVR